MDILDILNDNEVNRVSKLFSAALLTAIEENITKDDRIRYSMFLDLCRLNMEEDMDEESKDEYGAFVTLVSKKLADRFSYDRELLFLLWGLLPRKRWAEKESIVDWTYEVVEPFFESRGWDIKTVYSNLAKAI